jgi:molybdate transport repressor ModE-like protein
MLNLTQLKVLEAVARHGSVTVAAKELHYSQPSISHHLGRLEAATGAKLIQRVGRVGGCERSQLLHLARRHRPPASTTYETSPSRGSANRTFRNDS